MTVSKNTYSKWVKTIDYLEKEDKQKVEWLKQYFTKNINNLYEIYGRSIDKEDSSIEEIKVSKSNNIITFTCKDTEITIPKNHFKEFISGVIGLCQEYLPLGSIIKLKNDTEEVPTYIMIADRLITKKASNLYIDYSGIVYPVGMHGGSKYVYFNAPMIDKVIHKGYTDEQEETYLILAKTDMIIEQGKIPFGIGEKEEQAGFQEA